MGCPGYHRCYFLERELLREVFVAQRGNSLHSLRPAKTDRLKSFGDGSNNRI